ncbi:MAG: hypothetical protein QOG72_1255 [Sphingomonadales bacterium]|jgi:hypothetical protein|nr:hypothetical protein [Sphingomonadales bacterium]
MPQSVRWAGSAAILLGAATAVLPAASAQRAGAMVHSARADLADMAAGRYLGDVISDARGSSRSNVRLTVVKVGPNQVRVTADYARLPAFAARLTRAMDSLQNADGDAVFLLDLSKQPRTLMVTVDDASWAGARE